MGDPRHDALLTAVSDSARHVSTLAVTLVAVGSYLWLVTAGITDEVLLRGGSLTMPLVAVSLPVKSFFFWAPFFLAILHINYLVQVEGLRQKVHRLREDHEDNWEDWRPLLAPSAASLAADRPSTFTAWVFYLAMLFIAVSPLWVLLWMEYSFLPYQDHTTWAHAVCVVGATFATFVAIVPHMPPTYSLQFGSLIVLLLVAVSALRMANLPNSDPLKRLEIRGRVLVAEPPPEELLQEMLKAGIPRHEVERRYSVGLSLTDRSFQHADFTGSRLYSADLRGSDLTDAKLVNVDLYFADLGPLDAESWSGQYRQRQERGNRLGQLQRLEGWQPTVLTEADLTNARLPGAILTAAELRGAVLDGVDLTAAEILLTHLENASIVGADLRLAHLRRSWLDNAVLAGGTDLSGADLRETSLVGTDFKEATLHLADLRDIEAGTLTDFSGASMAQVSFAGSTWQGASFDRADVSHARGLNPRWVFLRGATITGACLCAECPVADGGKPAEAPAETPVVKTTPPPSSPPPLSPADPTPPVFDLRRLRTPEKPPHEIQELFADLSSGQPNSLRIPGVSAHLKEVEDRWSQMKDAGPCRPKSELGVEEESPPSRLKDFHESLAVDLVNDACEQPGNQALAQALRELIPGPESTDHRDPILRELSRALTEAGAVQCLQSHE